MRIGRREKTARGIRFRTYPYTVTRVKVMKSKLLRERDYARMKKAGLNEIIRLLEESEYKKEIDFFSKEYRGVELIELATNENLANVVNKLLRISLKKEVRLLIEFYSLKWILNNVKLVLRTRMNKLGENDLKYGVIPINPTNLQTCLRMYKESEEDFLEMTSMITHIDSEVLRELYRANKLMELENEIDRTFYARMLELKNKIKLRKADPLKQFFDHLVYFMNIKNIVRFKKEGADEETLWRMLVTERSIKMRKPAEEETKKKIMPKKKLMEKMDERKAYLKYVTREEKLLERMVKAEDLKKVFDALKESRYRELVTPEVEENVSRLEGSINRFLLLYASKLLHRKPLSVSPIFGYLLAKEIEINNIRLLVHAKAMNLDEKFVDSNIIVPEESLLKVMQYA